MHYLCKLSKISKELTFAKVCAYAEDYKDFVLKLTALS